MSCGNENFKDNTELYLNTSVASPNAMHFHNSNSDVACSTPKQGPTGLDFEKDEVSSISTLNPNDAAAIGVFLSNLPSTSNHIPLASDAEFNLSSLLSSPMPSTSSMLSLPMPTSSLLSLPMPSTSFSQPSRTAELFPSSANQLVELAQEPIASIVNRQLEPTHFPPSAVLFPRIVSSRLNVN